MGGVTTLGGGAMSSRAEFWSEPPFDARSEDQQIRFWAEVCAALCHRQLADLYEGPFPLIDENHFSIHGPEQHAWRVEHRIGPAQVDIVMQRELPQWWAEERLHSIWCVLNERGEALANRGPVGSAVASRNLRRLRQRPVHSMGDWGRHMRSQ